jgi:ABC-type Fe3+/spermidine/putrescine transport system ATPase subunit
LEDSEDGLSGINSCFKPRGDKPLRDAVNKIKRDIISKVGSEEWAKPYLIRGENGQNKRIAISRDLVSYADVDFT